MDKQRLLKALRGAANVWTFEGLRRRDEADQMGTCSMEEEEAHRLRGLADEYFKQAAECDALIDELLKEVCHGTVSCNG